MVTRARADRCPGALSLHEAADGLLARVRLPGGLVPAGALAGLADLAERRGAGVLELTSRGNVQLRGLTDGPAVAEAVAELGLLPSMTHERVRNVLASPLAGLDDRGVELEPLVAELDRRLCDEPGMAELPGRFLFGLDDGRADVIGFGPDVTAINIAGDRWLIAPVDLAVPTAGVVTALLATAEAFLAERAAQGGTAWRMADLVDGPRAVAQRVRATLGIDPTQLPTPPAAPGFGGPVGAIDQPDGRRAVSIVAPLGRLTAHQARLLASYGTGRKLRVSPWRSVIVPDQPLAEPILREAEAAGLGTTEGSPWYGLSACTGRPGCAKAQADIRADAAAARHERRTMPVHWSGCERRCGHPRGRYLDVLATGAGYQIRESAG
jgi:precorrin-3B synthase